MIKKILLIISLLFYLPHVFSQNFEFTWETDLFSFENFEVKVIKDGHKRHIKIKATWTKDSVRSRISRNDCDSLYNFCRIYDFPKENNIVDQTYRVYVDTISIKDPDRVLINGDTVYKARIMDHGYRWSSDSNKFYYEDGYEYDFTDGDMFNGMFATKGDTLKYCIYSPRINKEDFALNRFVFYLMQKYNREIVLAPLKHRIIVDKPSGNSYK